MLNDPDVWPEPQSFRPERFLDKLSPDQFDPKEVVFGFGRRFVLDLFTLRTRVADPDPRQCPGQYLAEATVYGFLMNLIWAFEIRKVDGDDSLDPQNPAFVDAAIRCVYASTAVALSISYSSRWLPLAPPSLSTVFSGTDVDYRRWRRVTYWNKPFAR
jgi:Cytochrome P450